MAVDAKWKKDMQQHIAGGTQLEGEALKKADYNQDGKVTINDVSTYERQNTPDDVVYAAAEKKVDNETSQSRTPGTASTLVAPVTPTTPSQVESAKQKLDSELQPYTSKWQGQIDSTMKALQNRKPFSYDLNGDILYQQYAEQFGQNADKAMKDTVGQVSSLSGGYGNSYAQTAGQQAYAENMGRLNDVIPELYRLALDKYNQEGQELKDILSIYKGMEESDYGRYRDEVEDSQWQQSFDYTKGKDERDFQYMKDRDEVEDSQWQQSFDYTKGKDERDFQYMKDRDEVEDSQWQQTHDEDIRQFDEKMSYQKDRDKIDDEWRQKEYDENVRQFNTSVELDNMSLEQQKYEFDKTFSLEEKQMLYDSGKEKILLGVKMTPAERAAWGVDEKGEKELQAKYKAANASVSSGGGSGNSSGDKKTNEGATPTEWKNAKGVFEGYVNSKGYDQACSLIFQEYPMLGLTYEEAVMLASMYLPTEEEPPENKSWFGNIVDKVTKASGKAITNQYGASFTRGGKQIM